MKRRGFTFIEMLVVTAIVILVAAEFCTTMILLFRLQRNRMWNAEFANMQRIARERILYHAVRENDNKIYGGLLGATNLTWSGDGVIGANFQRTGETGAPDYSDRKELETRFKVDGLDDGEAAINDSYVTNGLVFLEIKTSADYDGIHSNRIERVAVPAFLGGGGTFEDLGWGRFIKNPKVTWKAQP